MKSLHSLRRGVANLSLARKFILLCILLTIGVVTLAVAAARLQYLDLVEARKASVKTQVEMGMSILEYYAGRTDLDEAAAKAAALEALAQVRTNGGVDYFFAVDPELRLVLHPTRPAGTDMSDYRSEEGQYVYRDLLAAATSGDGFTEYSAPKPGSEGQQPKFGYSQVFPAWNWTLSMGVYADDIQASAWQFTRILTAIGAGLIAVFAGLCWLIATLIGNPLRKATVTAEAIAAGRFDNDIVADTRDETGRLLASMQQMQTQLQRFNAEMQQLIALQKGENVAHRMPEDFPGDYGTMAQGVNEALFEHIDAMNDAIGVMDDYGRGDLSRDMRRLPGQRAVLHESLDAVKRNLSGINAEIRQLADAAARGDFSARGDEARYAFAFRDMVAALNRLMQQADSGLADVGRIIGAIAAGDLTQRVERHYEGAFGELASAANSTAEQLTGIVRGIQQSAESISTASGEIATGNTDLSARTEQQAANLEETAASMEELTSTVRQNAENARQANQLALGAGNVATSGGEVMTQVVSTMQAISSASSRIGDIIGVIDGIAFQTNILALNAAVEAARAGEQGRGFAVVASEVRSLAQRSAEAAKEIKTLISDSVEKVGQGSELVTRAGATMDEVVTSVRRVTDIMAEITAASTEQSAGIEQVSRTVVDLDQVTQQNAALVEEATAAARSLEDQAAGLTQAVSVFRIDGAAPRHVRTPAVAARPAATSATPTRRPAPARPAPVVGNTALAQDADWAEF